MPIFPPTHPALQRFSKVQTPASATDMSREISGAAPAAEHHLAWLGDGNGKPGSFEVSSLVLLVARLCPLSNGFSVAEAQFKQAESAWAGRRMWRSGRCVEDLFRMRSSIRWPSWPHYVRIQ